jgi:hypothetical protein
VSPAVLNTFEVYESNSRFKSFGSICENKSFPEYFFPRSGFGNSVIPKDQKKLIDNV